MELAFCIACGWVGVRVLVVCCERTAETDRKRSSQVSASYRGMSLEADTLVDIESFSGLPMIHLERSCCALFVLTRLLTAAPYNQFIPSTTRTIPKPPLSDLLTPYNSKSPNKHRLVRPSTRPTRGATPDQLSMTSSSPFQTHIHRYAYISAANPPPAALPVAPTAPSAQPWLTRSLRTNSPTTKPSGTA